MTHSIKQKKIAIVGGGPGGLTLARLLQLGGANVKVYERDLNKDVRVQGATLDLHVESGLEALRRAGLTEAFYQHYRPEAGKMRILDKHANIKMDAHDAEGFDEQRPEIDRGPLRKILLASLESDTMVWDSQFMSMSEQNGKWTLLFKNGTTAEADLVIAADGANSKIRPYINSVKPVYSGVTIVEGTIPHAEKNAPHLYKLVDGGKIFAFGDEQTLILSTKGDGSLCFYTGCKVDEFWVRNSGIDFTDKQQVHDWFKEQFGTWDAVWQELFSGNELSVIPRPQYHFPLDQCWESLSSVTLLGDAAHRMPPYAGEGVNMAMQDAFELSECLLNEHFTDTLAAITHYEKQMLLRASAITRVTLDSTEMMHSDDPINRMIKMFEEHEGQA